MMVACSDNNRENMASFARANDVKRISSYDVIMRGVADSSHFDWQLLSAIAYHESRFQTDARSNRGAIGLMQIMPRTARAMGYSVDSLSDPRVSVEVALKLLHTIEGMFRFPQTTPHSDRIKTILAAYNAGPGFMIDTRRQAASQGAAYNNWSVLREYITRNGTHRETVNFADKVYTKYTQYLGSN